MNDQIKNNYNFFRKLQKKMLRKKNCNEIKKKKTNNKPCQMEQNDKIKTDII